MTTIKVRSPLGGIERGPTRLGVRSGWTLVAEPDSGESGSTIRGSKSPVVRRAEARKGWKDAGAELELSLKTPVKLLANVRREGTAAALRSS